MTKPEMTYGKALETIKPFEARLLKTCPTCDIMKACGFIEGHDSRDAEVEELKKEIKELKENFPQQQIYPMGTTGLFTDRMGNTYTVRR